MYKSVRIGPETTDIIKKQLENVYEELFNEYSYNEDILIMNIIIGGKFGVHYHHTKKKKKKSKLKI